jgi:hypothetical protein
MQGQAILYFGDNTKRFAKVFSRLALLPSSDGKDAFSMNDSDKVARYAASWVFPFLQGQLPDGYAVRPVPENIQIQHRYGDKWLSSAKHQDAIEVELKAESRHTGNPIYRDVE